MHFARSIVLGYHSIPKIKWGSFRGRREEKWGSFRGRREEKWGSFRGRFGDHFRVVDHFGVGIILGAVQFLGCMTSNFLYLRFPFIALFYGELIPSSLLNEIRPPTPSLKKSPRLYYAPSKMCLKYVNRHGINKSATYCQMSNR